MILPLLLALATQSPRDPMLVSPAWLAAHLNDANLVVLHVGPQAGYDSLHIPGARLIQLREISSPERTPLLELPTPAALDSALEAKGISDDSRIVIYWSDDWFSPATRTYLTLVWAGLGARTSVLDGGLTAWLAERRPVTAAPPTVRPGRLTIRPRSDIVISAEWLAARLDRPDVALIDARDTRFYLGNYTSDPRPGHIPGAYSVPFFTVVDDAGRFRSPTQLRDMFRGVHAEPGDTVVAYCHIGQQATMVWFAARLAGLDARLYDGSFTQWSALTQYPVARP